MRLKNEIFAHVFDWLVKKKMVKDQQDLACKTGIGKNTISRIMTGKVEPKDDTLRKLNEAFDCIFNMQYLRGRSTTMLIKDVIYYEQHPEEDALRGFDYTLQHQEEETPIASEPDTTPYQALPLWASNLIDIMSQQIKQNEVLNRELRQTIQQVNQLKTDLQTALQTLKNNKK